MTADLPAQVAARYRGRFAQGFVRGKLRADPMLGLLLGGPALGRVLDLGCGRGQLALALLLAGHASNVTGIDADAAKIAAATQAAGDLPARFLADDIADAALPDADTILLIDVLYQMPPDRQHALLARLRAPRILLRAFDPDHGWRSATGRAMERLRRLAGGDLGRRGRVAPLPLDRLVAPLRQAGYRITLAPPPSGAVLPNVVIMAEHP